VNSRLLAFLVVSLPVLIGGVLFGPFAFDLVTHRRPPDRILIPAGYTGWVRVDFGVESAPGLPREQRRLLIPLQLNGTLKTSTRRPDGFGKDEYFYVSGDSRNPLSTSGVCKGGMIWGLETGSNIDGSSFERFFVGSEDQFRHEIDPAGKNFSACE
jgi:hypothetical protein